MMTKTLSKAFAVALMGSALAFAPAAMAAETQAPTGNPAGTQMDHSAGQPGGSATMPRTPAGETIPAEKIEKAPSTTATDTSVSKGLTFATQQEPGMMRTSEWIGLPIKNRNEETVGDVNDFVADESGKIQILVAGVGGFVGVGEKSVGVPFDQVSLSSDSQGNRVIMLDATKDQLTNAPEFKRPGQQS